MNASRLTIIFVGLVILMLPSVASARSSNDRPFNPGPTAATPSYGIAEHNIGRLALSVTNHGVFGDYGGNGPAGSRDAFTAQQVRSCEYPQGTFTTYLFAVSLWLGAIVGRDTLVSTGADGWSGGYELHPEHPDLGNMRYRSTVDPARLEFEGAISEQDFIAVYADTCIDCSGTDTDYLDGRRHLPINLEVTQRSFSWSYSYAEDFVLFDYAIKNIGNERVRSVYMGLYCDADIHATALGGQGGAQDDLCGFNEKWPAEYLPSYCPPDSDVVNIAWTIDNNGDLDQNTNPQVPNVTATRIVRTPSDSLQVSFNWWVSNGDASLDYGPQTRAGYRDLQTGGLGTPEGDRNKYYFMSNGEFDFDQVRCASIDALDPVWLPPPPNQAPVWATGLDTRYLLSFGPFDIEPQQTLPISLAYVAGENLHSDATNFSNLPNNWEAYYEGISFSDLGLNATWADWIYDNPGIDTDSDGYFGEMTICNLGTDSTEKCDTFIDTTADPDTLIIDCYWVYDLADTIWRKGDGVPDFRGASPPPAPSAYSSHSGVPGLRVEPSVGRVRIIWNGVLAENARDVFSRELDFEGYRVYVSRDERRSSYSLVASYDIEDYNKWEWNTQLSRWELLESPFLLDELRSLYGGVDPENWDPSDYPRHAPFHLTGFPDSIFYFEPQDFNRSILANEDNATTPIRKVYSVDEVPWPPRWIEPDSVPADSIDFYLTEDSSFFKYYEYEITVENLLPTVCYWFNVTAFDYGSPSSGLAALETSPTLLPAVTYPLASWEKIQEQDLKVFVYPNPYRSDADYRARGFEARGALDRARDRTRQVNFANLPPTCTIRIFSLDGDLIREIHHEFDPSDPLANHDTWNLITRNTQLVVSGLYYWAVEDDEGNTQVGKLAIIM